MPIDDRTSTQSYPKPNLANTLADDVGRLRTALDEIDADMAVRVTTSDTGTVSTAMLANDAVTYAKIQNVSATDKLLGRSTAGAGDVEEITCTAAGRALLDDADATAQRVTLGLGTLATQSGLGNITNAGAIGSTANLPIITTTSGVLTAGSFGTTANTFCQGNDSRLSDTRLTTNSATFNNGGAGGASGSTFNGSAALTVSYNTIGAPSTTGTNASGTWGISVSGSAATLTTARTLTIGATGKTFNGSADVSWSVNEIGAAQAGAAGAIVENKNSISANYTLTTGSNGISAGPVSIDAGVTVTVPSGASWVIV